MKSIIIRIAGLLATAGLIFGCGQEKKSETETEPSAQAEQTVPTQPEQNTPIQENAALPNPGRELPPQAEITPAPTPSPTAAPNQNDVPEIGLNEPNADAGSPQTAPDANSDQSASGTDINSFEPLSQEQRNLVSNITWDEDPEVLNAVKIENYGQHFLKSDELHPELFRESIENIGHTYIGIGTDQGYVFIGWQRPTLALMVDYDPWVIVMHKIYISLFKTCEDSECLLNYFEDRNKGMEYIDSQPELSSRLTKTVFKEGHRGVTYSLRAIRRMKAKTFMNDPETFKYIKDLINSGRLVTFQANLLGDKAFSSIQTTLNKLGAEVGVLYLSNAEQYWPYSEQYKKNMSELPYSDNAQIIRTIATKPFNNDYRYSVQKADVFKAWLAHPDTKSVKNIVGRTKIKTEEDIPLTIDNKLPKSENE